MENAQIPGLTDVDIDIINDIMKRGNMPKTGLDMKQVQFLFHEYKKIRYAPPKNAPKGKSPFNTFTKFVRYCIQRNFANYDTLILLTSDKGCLTDDMKLLSPEYINLFPDGIPLKMLIDKGPIDVYSYNITKKKIEIKQSLGVEFIYTTGVYELVLANGKKIKGTQDHPFMTVKHRYKQLKNLTSKDSVITVIRDERGKLVTSLSKVVSVKSIGTKDVYDVVSVKDNGNFFIEGVLSSNTGKCVYFNSKNDFILSADGSWVHPEKAKEIVLMDDKMKMRTAKVRNRFDRIAEDVYEVKLRSGKRICITNEHPLFTINGWKPLNQLDKHDFIATPRKYNLNLTKTINEGLVKLIAYLIADGFMGGGKLEFTKNDELIRSDFKKSLAQYDTDLAWGDSVRIISTLPHIYEGNTYLPRNTLIGYLKKVGLYECRSGTKFIPKDIMQLSNTQIALFLNRLYSCDGGVEIGKRKPVTREINYTSKSELLIRQIQHLMLRFGIISKMCSKFKRATNAKNHKGSTYWQLTISGKENIILFHDNIGFLQQDKHKKLVQIYDDVMSLTSNTNTDIIPAGFFKDYTFKHSIEYYSNHFKVVRFTTSRLRSSNVSRRIVIELSNIEDDEKLSMMANSDIFWDRIESIDLLEKHNVKVYDLEVDHDMHNFVCNDIIIHNSSCAIQMARTWCKLVGIRFNPKKHIAYNNEDVIRCITELPPFSPLICDEAIRFACIADNSEIQTEDGVVKIKDLVNKKNFKVLSYNEKTKKSEYKNAEKCVKTKYEYVYVIETECGKKIKATKEHKFLTNNGWKMLSELKEGDDINGL